MKVEVLAFDQGETTGWAVHGENGPVMSAQDSLRGALATTIPWLKANPVPLVVIEGVFVGPGAHASLETAIAHGFIEGAIWACGYRGEIWAPKASSWRKHFGMNSHVVEGNSKRPPTREELEERARDTAKALTGRWFTEDRTHEAEAICMASAGWERWVMRGAA